jgi:hypothetical protein
MAIIVPSEAPIGMDSRMPFTISPKRRCGGTYYGSRNGNNSKHKQTSQVRESQGKGNAKRIKDIETNADV